MSTGFDLSKLIATGITFESQVPGATKTGQPIPQVEVGYKGKYIGSLFQYTSDTPHPRDSILPGQWFAIVASGNKEFDDRLNSIQPGGRALEDLKRLVQYFAKLYLK